MYPLVSVIIPAYNSASTLERAINSVLLQDYPNLEIIIIDDFSNDNTRDMVKKYVSRDSHMRCFCLEKNSGPANARNTGVNVAQGEYLAFLDADDEWTPDKLGRQVEFLLDNPNVDVVFTDCTNINTSNNVSGKLSEINGEFLSNLTLQSVSGYSDFFILDGPYRREMYRKFFILISSVLMRRSGFDLVNGFNPNRFGTEDVDFFVRLSSRASFAYWYQEKVLRYQSDSGISSIGEKWLNELSKYHKTCLSAAEYGDLHGIARHNLLKTYRSLIVFYAMNGMPMKALNIFRESLGLGFYPRLAAYALASFAGPLPFRIWQWRTSTRFSSKMIR